MYGIDLIFDYHAYVYLCYLDSRAELHPTNQQKTLLAKHGGVAHHAYNWGLWLTRNILQHNLLHPDSKIKFPTAIDLHKLLVAMVKPKNFWYYEVPKTAPYGCFKIFIRCLETLLY
nr:helix-turn-helix domain-containing protein [Okeania sp. SIO2F4]